MQMGRNKKIFFIIGSVLLFILYQVIQMVWGQYPITNFPPQGTTVVAFGDSLVEGVGASSPENNFISLLAERLNVGIINKGVSGNTTGDALLRIDTDVTPLHPDIVIVLLGGNDYLRHVPPEETFANLKTIITKIQSQGAVVLLLGVRGGLLHDNFNASFEELAKETGSSFVPNVLDGIMGNSKLMSDEVHPNDAGYLKIADKIAPTLDTLVLSATNKTQMPQGETGTERNSPSSE